MDIYLFVIKFSFTYKNLFQIALISNSLLFTKINIYVKFNRRWHIDISVSTQNIKLCT